MFSIDGGREFIGHMWKTRAAMDISELQIDDCFLYNEGTICLVSE